MRCCCRSIVFLLMLMLLLPNLALTFSRICHVVRKFSGRRVSACRLQQQQKQQLQTFSDFERPSTFLDSQDNGNNDINVVFLKEDNAAENDYNKKKNNQNPVVPMGKKLQQRKWGDLKSKFQQRLEEKRNRKNKTREEKEPLQHKESHKDMKRRT
jgi:hypothetical protein